MVAKRKFYGSVVATIDSRGKIVTLTWDRRKARPSTGQLKSSLAIAQEDLMKFKQRGYAFQITWMGDDRVSVYQPSS